MLEIDDGKVPPPEKEMSDYVEDDIIFPAQFCDLKNVNSVDNMIKSTYPNFFQNW